MGTAAAPGVAEAAPDAGPGGPPDAAPARRSAWWPALVPVVVVVAGAWAYRWVDEDAFINFRVIANVLAGRGPVYNVGERVDVSSDPLWVAVLTLVHAVTPFASLAWTSVVLGLVCTAGGFLAGGLAAVRLAGPRESGTVVPLGMAAASVVAGVWEFATSGLEMSMVFLWLGFSTLLLVRVEGARRRALPAAVVLGLGGLIRPELTLAAAVFVAALVTVVAAPGWGSATGRLRRCAAVVAVALALPVAVTLLQAAYYALLVPSTALAKDAGGSWWSQGATYLGNLVAPYALWLPALLAVPLVAARAARWWRAGDRTGTVVLLAPLAAGLVDAGYVVRLGGDYMHARLLLPALFACCLPVWVTTAQRRTWAAVPAAGIAVWAVVCLGWLRFVPTVPHVLGLQTVFISNERDSWIAATGRAHPVTAGDYAGALSGRAAAVLSAEAARVPSGAQRMVVITDPFAPVPRTTLPARSALPFRLAVDLPAIGVIGYLVGPEVYVFDSFSLADPIGSHTSVTRHARPGHEKLVGPAWMVGRFGVPGATTVPGGPGPVPVAAARAAVGCGRLHAYLTAITAPWTPSRAWANLTGSPGFTTFRFSADPVRAAAQLCGPGGGR